MKIGFEFQSRIGGVKVVKIEDILGNRVRFFCRLTDDAAPIIVFVPLAEAVLPRKWQLRLIIKKKLAYLRSLVCGNV